MCVCVCLSVSPFSLWKWCEKNSCADVVWRRLKSYEQIRGVVHCQLDSLGLFDYFILPCLPRADREEGRERLTLFFFTPSFPTTILRQSINTYSLSHTMFAATNVQQTAFVGEAVAMKSRTTVRYESVVIYIRVIV